MASSRETMRSVRLKRSVAPSRRAILLWFIVLKPLKTRRGTDRFSGPELAPPGIYFRGNAIRTLFDGLVTRNHEVGSFETICGAVQEGNSAVVHCTKTLQKLGEAPIALAARS